MDRFQQLLDSAGYRDELILAEIVDITSQLVGLYKCNENLSDRQYIFCKLKEILKVSKEQKMDKIHVVILQAVKEITKV